MELDFQIDKLTRSIENTITGESFPTEVFPLLKSDLQQITKKNGWLFNWKSEFNLPDREVSKLTTMANPAVIQGLVSIFARQNYVEMYLIESAPFNFGKNKMYFGVSGNLIAYACKRSFEYGFKGFVGFTAKTSLIEHYVSALGAVHLTGQRMAIEEKQARFLVNKYFSNFKINE